LSFLGNFAAIDLGSNTFHLVIFKDGGGDAQILFKVRKAVGIGKNGLEKQRITADALKRGIDALLEFKTHVEEFSCKKVQITATSAFRNAQNKDEVLREIKLKTGFDVTIIDGDQEAHLIYEGVKRDVKLTSQNALIMDIGGGSVEFILCNQNQLIWKESFEIGGIRLMERFHKTDPISEENISELQNYLEQKLKSLVEACQLYRPSYLIGASGTFDTLCDIRNETNDNVKELFMLSLDEYHEIANLILSKHYQGRLSIPGMIAMRAEMICVACVLIETVIDKCSLEYIRCSQFALKEGLMYRMLND
jgi:exopolyphosphatase/guanosine-5'-triphosphate,3'-diphosphate pyrophosphatase